jgi:two-component system chemotaxis response regulator CheY
MPMFPADTNILVVDDMLTMRKLVVKSLKELGFSNFVEATNGAEAYEKLAATPIQLIISDWNMPQTTGLDLLKRIRAEAKTAHLPFIMVTAEAEKSQIVEAVQAGVSNYVVKPFTTQSLKEKLEAVAAKLGM